MNETNEPNELEKQLSSWTLRRPSAAIERRLWPAPQRAPQRVRTLPWLAPAMACCLAGFMWLNQPGGPTFGDGQHAAMMGAVLSNQSYIAYLPNNYQPANNRLDSFEWTNGGSSASSMRFVSPRRGNE